MEKKKVDFGTMAADAGKAAQSLLNQARQAVVKAADQNDDGKLDIQDANIVINAIGTAVKDTTANLQEMIENKKQDLERKALCPLFVEDMEKADFLMPRLLHITEMDKRRAESEVCQGSIGFMSVEKELPVISVFRQHIDKVGVSFYPDTESAIYYVDPSDRNRYIALDDYFSYLKIARVNELQRIAQDLGAKYFRVTYSEQKTSFVETKAKVKTKGDAKLNPKEKADIGIEVGADYKETEMSTVEIAAEMRCQGHTPIEPTLYYLQRENSVLNLISMRMNEASPIMHHRFRLKLSNSSGIKEQEAVKIDAALKAMKFSGNTTVASEARNEARRFFEYEIDF